MTDPKVSEKISNLIDDLVGEIHCHQCECMPDTRPDPATANSALLSAIAELEQRAEKAEAERDKWREAAVAYQKWRDAYFKWEPDELVEHPQVHLDLEAAQDRLEAATAAAVTEWYQRPHRGDADEADLYDLIGAFVRGEKLPRKGDA